MRLSENHRFFPRRLPAFVALIASAILIQSVVHAQPMPGNSSLVLPNQDDSLHRTWQFGGLFTGGFVPFYEIHMHYPYTTRAVELNFFNAGAQIGRMLTAPRGPAFLRGRGEALLEITPFWLADYPSQADRLCFVSSVNGGQCGNIDFGPYRRYGASVTPFLLRWNFMKSERSRLVPWAQLGGGLLWTNHKFPLLGGSTSVINFTPQVDAGESFFIRRNRSLDFAVKAVHISNASLGDNDPGLNVTLQFSVGYSWWK